MKQTAAHSAKRSGHGGIGRLGGFRFHCQKRAGSSPVARTMTSVLTGFNPLRTLAIFIVHFVPVRS